MTVDEMLAEAANRGLQLAGLRQYAYRLGDTSKKDHWEAHFHDAKGNGVSGAGRSARQALQNALYPATSNPEAKPNPKTRAIANDDNSLSFLD